ncbi:hypothetical protein M3Y99_01191200 [Aphelenchoides fujianensis]|nr:hypothetical protein M3Y99_01191200 [Aphelenchoides fujianensis]
MSNSANRIRSLLEKMQSADEDFRYTVTNYLMMELQKDSIKLDDDTERRVSSSPEWTQSDRWGFQITKALLGLLDDRNGEVRNLAVRCFTPLAAKVKMQHIELVVDQLCKNLETDQERLRDVSSIALKTVISGLTPQHNANQTAAIAAKVVPNLLTGLRSQKRTDSSIKIEIRDIIGIIVNKFHRHGGIDLRAIEDALRKRAIIVLGILVESVDEPAFEAIVERLLQQLKQTANTDTTRAYVLAAATVVKANPRLFSKRLDEFVELLVTYAQNNDDELKEACLHAFETFIARCNREIIPYLKPIVDVSTKLIKYGANYEYDDEEEDDGADEMEVDDADNEESDVDAYSDDDDMSWKEREESVKADIFRAYEALLKQTQLFLPESLAELDAKLYHCVFNIDGPREFAYTNEKFRRVLQEDVDQQQRAVLNALAEQVPQLVRALGKQVKSRSASIRLHCFALLISLLRALPGALEHHFESLLSAIKQAIQEKASDSSAKIDPLLFLHLAFCSHEPKVFRQHLNTLVPLITKSSLIVVLRQLAGEGLAVDAHVEEIYRVIYSKLQMNDIDQEVKERSIASAGILLSNFGSKLAAHVGVILSLLADRLRNEMTRHIAVQAFCVIVGGTDAVDLSPVVSDLLVQLADFLRKNQRGLRVSTLSLLSALTTNYSSSVLPADGVKRVIRELPALMVEADMYISQLAIKLARDMMSKFPQSMGVSVQRVMINSCIHKARTGALIGRSLEYAVNLFVVVVGGRMPKKLEFSALANSLMDVGQTSEKPSRQVYVAIATILANAAKASNSEKDVNKLLNELVSQVYGRDLESKQRLFSLYALGEIGRFFPEAFDNSPLVPNEIIKNRFDSATEEVKTVASYALGSLATGNAAKYLPVLLTEIKTNPKRQYIIASQNAQETPSEVFLNSVGQIWTVLLSHSQAPGESTRNVVAECMGKICRIKPADFLPELIKTTKEGHQLARSTAVTAVRSMIVDSTSRTTDEYLHQHLAELLRGINDEDMTVRRTSIMTLNSAAHNKPRWVKELLPTLLPSLYHETVINQDLVHEVDMGHFKHIVDDGLDLRKSAYEWSVPPVFVSVDPSTICSMYTLMEHCLDRLDVLEYMNYIEDGLKDQHDIKLLNLLMLTRLSQTCSVQMSQRIDRFAELIIPLLHTKPRPNSVKQENDKLDELKRACIRTILTLKRVPILERSTKLSAAFETIRQEAPLKAMMETIEKDQSMKLLTFHNDDVVMGSDI